MTEHKRFGLVFTKTRVYKFGHCILLKIQAYYWSWRIYSTAGSIQNCKDARRWVVQTGNEYPGPGYHTNSETNSIYELKFLISSQLYSHEGTKTSTLKGTPTKRQVSKRQVSKRPASKRLKRQVYKTSALQNVRFTKCQVYKTSGLQNVRLQKTSLYSVLVVGGNPQVLLQPC